MFYSIKFENDIGSRNSWDDWMLIPTSRPLVSVPEAKIKMVDIPGGNGSLDLTDVLGDTVVYGTRHGSWEFAVANPNITIEGLQDYEEANRNFGKRKWISDIDIPDEDSRSWIDVYTDIMQFLHGRKTLVRMSDDPRYRYLGRLSVNEWRSEEKYSKVVIDYELQPFKFPDSADPEKACISKAFGGRL